jgi:ABC-2 type transport system permease protein
MGIKKIIKIYIRLLSMKIGKTLTYRTNSVLGLLVDFGYQLFLIVFVNLLFGSINSVKGWSFYQMLLLTGFSILASQLMLAFCYVDNIWRLPKRINEGVIDFYLLKPIDSLFMCTLQEPYISGFIGSLSGLFIIVYSISKQSIPFDFISFGLAIICFVCGLLVYYCIYTLVTSLAFVVSDTNTLPLIAVSIMEFRNNPKEIYSRPLQAFFSYIVPVVLVAGVPSYIIINQYKRVDLAVVSLGVSVCLFILTKFVWSIMIRNYTSASS